MQQTQKKPSLISIKAFVPSILVAALIGTYLDLYFVGKDIYAFPKRPFPATFQLNIAFTLIGLPIISCIFLVIQNLLRTWLKIWLILIISLYMSLFERVSETFGFFTHIDSWKHTYSFVGYLCYLSFITVFHQRWNR
ncbi:MAG: CBO0543 family protein [Heyndrickxia sp.]